MIHYRTIVLGPLIAVGFSMTAYAVPSQIDYASITQATLEDFQSLALGDLSLPVSFTGFTYSESGTAQIVDADACNGANDDRCLGPSLTNGPFVFDGLATTAFGFDLFSERNLIATVSGNSGSVAFDIGPGGSLLGFFDPLGLISISLSGNLTNGGLTATNGQNSLNGAPAGLLNARPGSPGSQRPNPSITFGLVSIDDVITGPAVTQVPVPATAPLFLAGLGGLAFLRRRAGDAHKKRR